MEINEKDYLLGIWFVGWGTGDWMAAIKRGDGPEFQLQYRFRYYEDQKAFDSDDRKSWYRGTLTDTNEDIVIKKINLIAATIAQSRQEADVLNDHVLVRGGTEKFLEAMKGKDWMHLKSVNGERAATVS